MKRKLRGLTQLAKKLSPNRIAIVGGSMFTMLLLSSPSLYAQQPGFPFVDAGADVVLDCDDPCTELTATYFDTGETTDYEVVSIDYDPPFPFTGGTPVSVNTDDVWSPIIPLPFDFCYYGDTYTEFLIGSNGVVTFDLVDNDPGGYCPYSFSASIPSASLISGSVNGAYMDINPAVSGSGVVNYTFFGEAPARTLVVNFPNIPYFGSACTGLTMTSQIVFYETTNIIDVYVENRPSGCSWNSGNALIGLQNVGGTDGITPPGRNTEDWSATEEAWRFIPTGDSNVEFVWLDENDDVIGTSPTIEVCPSETTTYTAQATYTNCNGDVVIESDTVTVTFGGTSVSLDLGEDQSFCDVASFEIVPVIEGADADEVAYLWSTGETTPTIVVTETGDYTLEITIENCTITDSVYIEFGETPEIDLGLNFETCFENEIFLDASPLNYDVSEVTFEWFLDGAATGQTDAVIEALDYGVYSVIVTAGDCSAEVAITISPREDLEVTLSAPVSACTNEQVTITANTNESGVTYTWFENGEVMDGQTGSSITVTTPSETSNLSFIYGVEIVKGDCSGSAEVEFSVLKCIISQGISPGGSIGQNDILDLEFLANRTGINSLQIFNRLGSLVYERQNYVNEWGGQDKNGNELPTGTYFYLLNFAGEDPVYGTQHNGWIYINRDAN